MRERIVTKLSKKMIDHLRKWFTVTQ